MCRSLLLLAFAIQMLPQSARAADGTFAIQIVDEATHRGVPLAILETTDHTRYVSDSAGWVAFAEPGLMSRRVLFALSSPGYVFAKDASGATSTTLEMTPGGTAEISAMRSDSAERMYRITGAGIYRDSTLLGLDAPLPRPNMNAGVLCQGYVQAALHAGRIFWVWAQTLLVTRTQGLRQSVGAFSEMPGGLGLDPSMGVHFDYLLDGNGEPSALLPSEAPGTMVVDGIVSVKDAQGAAHLVGHYARMKDATTQLEHGLAELNESHRFNRLISLGDDYTWQFPQGHAVSVTEGSVGYIYFATPLCHTRCLATYEAVTNPVGYEALALDPGTKTLVWQKAQPPLSQKQETELVARKALLASSARAQTTDVISHQPIALRSGSVQWNAFRKCWIMLASAGLKGSSADTDDSGEVWYAEAATVSGPWGKALRVASHGAAHFDAPCHHAFFDQKEGQLIYFEGGYRSREGCGVVPRYESNQLMYRLDLADERLRLLSE